MVPRPASLSMLKRSVFPRDFSGPGPLWKGNLGKRERGHSYSYVTKHTVGFGGGIPSLQNLGSRSQRVVNSKPGWSYIVSSTPD